MPWKKGAVAAVFLCALAHQAGAQGVAPQNQPKFAAQDVADYLTGLNQGIRDTATAFRTLKTAEDIANYKAAQAEKQKFLARSLNTPIMLGREAGIKCVLTAQATYMKQLMDQKAQNPYVTSYEAAIKSCEMKMRAIAHDAPTFTAPAQGTQPGKTQPPQPAAPPR